MISDLTIPFALIAAAAVAMASNRMRFDLIALLVVLGLMLSGVLTVQEALSGFGSPVVIVIACLLIVGEMLDRTGVARLLGDWILRKGGKKETKLLVLIMASAGILGSIMSSTAVVAIFIPIVLRIAAKTGLSVSRLLLPMSYAALISGMMTLIATSPNLVVSEELVATGYAPLGFFSFTLVGLGVLTVGIVYMITLGRRLLPDRTTATTTAGRARELENIWEDYRVDRIHVNLRIDRGSPLIGRNLADAALSSRYGARVLGVRRPHVQGDQVFLSPAGDFALNALDQLFLVVNGDVVETLLAEEGLTRRIPTAHDRRRFLWEMGGITTLIHPESQLIGKSLRDARFRSRFGVDIIGLRRSNEAVKDFEDLKLQASDSLFGVGPWSRIRRLKDYTHEFLVMEMPSEEQEVVPAYPRMPLALGILAAMVLLSVFDVVPLVVGVMMAALAGVSTRCLSAEDAYRAIHWQSLVLVAGMLPLADALQNTGGSDLIVNALLTGIGDPSPLAMFSVIFFLTAGLGLFLSNTASAVLVVPIAITSAESLGLSPYPFAVGVLIAASAAFVTPVSTPVVTLVFEPGRYRFTDVAKVGVPLLLLTYLTALVLVPLLFPW
jgi:di/tricarboxylate transporter